MSSCRRSVRGPLGQAVLAGTFLLGAVLAGCQSPRSSRPADGALIDSLAEGYQWLEDRYEQMGEAMPPVMRGMDGRMQAMRNQMMGERGQAGNGRMGRMKGRMDDQGTRRPSSDTAAGRFPMGHGDMSAMHQTMARMHGGQMAAWHGKMAAWHEQMMGGSSGGSVQGPGETTRNPASLYAQQCASCHGQNGEGVSGAFPPLAGSAWVTGEISTLVRIVLHGVEGPIRVRGQRYDGRMPAFGDRLSDVQLAGLLTYLRTSLNEEDSPVSAEEVGQIRSAYAERSVPWTADVLRSEESASSSPGD